MKLTLQNKTATLNFARDISDSYVLRHGDYQLRGSVIDRYGKDGGEEVGDKRIKARRLIIEFGAAKQEAKRSYRHRIRRNRSYVFSHPLRSMNTDERRFF